MGYSLLQLWLLCSILSLSSSADPKGIISVPVPPASERRLSQIESKLQSLTGEVQSLSSKLQSCEKGQKALLNSYSALSLRVGKMETEIRNLTTGYERLDALNLLWKRNFKVVNNTFTALRTRLSIQVLPILGF